MKKFLARTVAFAAPLLPLAAFAAPGDLSTVGSFIGNIMVFINKILVPAIFGLAFLVFIWGVFKTFILGGSDEDKQKEGKQLMMYAIAGFVLMVSIWGIVKLVSDGIGLQQQGIHAIPDLPSSKK